jgi:hypothetical protein
VLGGVSWWWSGWCNDTRSFGLARRVGGGLKAARGGLRVVVIVVVDVEVDVVGRCVCVKVLSTGTMCYDYQPIHADMSAIVVTSHALGVGALSR